MTDPSTISAQPPPENLTSSSNVERESAELTLGSAAPLLISEDNLPSAKRPITRAEKVFDSTLYGGFMGVFNAVYSVWLGDQVREGRGKALFERTAEYLTKRTVPPNASPEHFAKAMQRIKQTSINVVLTGCGIALLFPMKWFENRKPQIVRLIHEKYTKSDDPEKAAQEEAALKQLDNTPVLGWGPIITGRAVGMVGPFTASWYGAKYVQHVEDAAAKFAEHDLKLRSPGSARYARMISLELLYTGICTAGLYIYTHFISPPKHKQKGDSPAPEAPSAAPPADIIVNTAALNPPEPAKNEDCARCKYLKPRESRVEKPRESYVEMVSTGGQEAMMPLQP